ncbi:MAG: hypothetical protein Ct9H300mP12_10070 [Acidimicrobiales bacterium]|nr:MAG: hypothetical protein Ct9H300mP12_10070 [Acidimicrobiales bacterium]
MVGQTGAKNLGPLTSIDWTYLHLELLATPPPRGRGGRLRLQVRRRVSDAYEVIGLWRYPVKSMAGEAVEAVELDVDGVAGDRQWGVRDLDTDRLASAKKPRPFGGLLDWSARITDDGTVGVASPGGQTWTAGIPTSTRAVPGLDRPLVLPPSRPAARRPTTASGRRSPGRLCLKSRWNCRWR